MEISTALWALILGKDFTFTSCLFHLAVTCFFPVGLLFIASLILLGCLIED